MRFTRLLILSQPIFSICFYSWNLLRDVYPPNADAIAIPIASDFIAWIIWAPLLLFVLSSTVFKAYPESIPLVNWNRDRPIWSILWTLLFLAVHSIALSNLPYDFKVGNHFEFIDTCLWTWLYLCLRAIIVAKPDILSPIVPRRIRTMLIPSPGG